MATSTESKTTSTHLALRFQKLKSEIHRQLVEGLDVSRLSQMKPDAFAGLYTIWPSS